MNAIDSHATFDDFYRLPVLHSDVHADLFDEARDPVTYAVPIPGGPSLRFAARVRPSKRLRIIMHGAVVRARDRYPRFDRVSTSVRSDDSFVSFADPTLTIDPELTLGWYTGNRDWDPAPTMLKVIDLAARASGAREVVLIGGSGGGFAALRLGARLPGSYAFVFAPQTSVARYRGRHFPALLEAGYGLRGETAAIDAYALHPGRFEVLSSYSAGTENRVYYLQSIDDPGHIGDHYNPFRRAIGLDRPDGPSADGRHEAVLADLALDGHGPPSAAEFDEHWARACRHWGI